MSMEYQSQLDALADRMDAMDARIKVIQNEQKILTDILDHFINLDDQVDTLNRDMNEFAYMTGTYVSDLMKIRKDISVIQNILCGGKDDAVIQKETN